MNIHQFPTEKSNCCGFLRRPGSDINDVRYLLVCESNINDRAGIMKPSGGAGGGGGVKSCVTSTTRYDLSFSCASAQPELGSSEDISVL